MEANAVEPQKESVQSIVNTTLSARQLYRHDPLLFLLKERLHLRNLWMSVGAMLLPGIVYLVWWLLWGSKFSSGWNPGTISSILIQTFALFPSLFFIYDCIPNAIAKTFNTLYTDDVIGKYRKDPADREAYARFKQQVVYWMDNNWWTATIIVVIILYALLRLFLRELPDRHDLLPLMVRTVVVIIYVPLMFATGMSVIRLVLALIFVNRLFYLFKLQIKPALADGSGRLRSLERLLWLCVSIMLWVAILLAAMILGRNVGGLTFPEVFLLGAIYILLIPTLLIGWLIFPHRMMVKARDEALQPLAIEYQQALMLSLSPKTQDTQGVAAEILHLETLKKRYDLVYNSFSVWPLETHTLSSAGVTVILPVILPLIFPFIVSFISFLLQWFGL
ncbi:hypothetical protein KSD_96420 [Ktedonobacter sp. SOSP1-85]|uniref:hypothetical protein n=1 Tax=Ktedonobacter sp. SOSP1-85 TaxID=2778367 RepID=UPI00191591A7|nr:hypothetical protein [Ktedonobacter sp. SOSP1-85]GHO81871.1 hypothetical protein KSD_96420 [Ktedonobacter sp. SOSP1-85]